MTLSPNTELAYIATTIFERLEDTTRRTTKRKPRADAVERRQAILDNLMANLAAVTLGHPVGTPIAISARNVKATRYDRPGFSQEVIMQMVKAMEDAGLIARERGRWQSRRTTIVPSAKLISMFPKGLDGSALSRAAGAETIILKASAGRGRPKPLIDYTDTAETVAMRREVNRLNAFMAGVELRLGAKRLPPVFLTRRFQIVEPDAPHTFNAHGRLYDNGTWQTLPKAQRHLLRLDGEPVADLDFVGSFPMLAHILAGRPLPNRDPYEGVEGLTRKEAKLALSALLCRTGSLRRLPRGLGDLRAKGWTAERLAAALGERHAPIAHLFGTGVGLRLMFTESRILMSAVGRLIAGAVPVLPMHDGIMVPKSREEVARQAMEAASRDVVGVVLPVVSKPVEQPQ